MKILVISQYYYPEPFRISDICEELSRRGHEVSVITGVPNYPMGKIYKGYRFHKRRKEIINGVRVHRCFTVGRRNGALWRFINYYSFALSSSIFAKQINEEYDIILVNQLSPIMMACPGIVYKKKHNKKLVLYCLDLWPESLVVGGITRESPIYKIFHIISKRIYCKADKILVTSKSFIDYFNNEFGIKDVEYLPQYSETLFTPESCKKESDGNLDLMFAGNLGAAQSIDTIIELARILNDEKNIHWHIVGDGSEFENLKNASEGLDTVVFYGRKPLEEMPKYYSMADAMLITMQDDQVLNMTLPGKVQTYMAAGKPIIGIIAGETKKVIDEAKCGICASKDDINDLANELINLQQSNLLEMSKNSRKYFDENFEKDLIINLLENILMTIGDIN